MARIGRFGLPIDPDRLHYEQARRGLSGAQLAAAAGLTPEALSRIKSGHPARPATLRRIADALMAAPVIEGVALFTSAPE